MKFAIKCSKLPRILHTFNRIQLKPLPIPRSVTLSDWASPENEPLRARAAPVTF